jgi:hypothetical protein
VEDGWVIIEGAEGGVANIRKSDTNIMITMEEE